MPDLSEVLDRLRGGDRTAMGEVYHELAAPLLSYLTTQVRRREDAEDLLGEVFVAAIRDIDSFTGDPGGFRAWLYRIATNRAIDLARWHGRRPEEPLEAAGERLAESDPSAEAIGNVERARVWAAVMALPDEQRRVMGLRLGGDLSAAEIAQVVGKRVGAVKALQHRALVNLSRALGGTSGAYPPEGSERLEEWT